MEKSISMAKRIHTPLRLEERSDGLWNSGQTRYRRKQVVGSTGTSRTSIAANGVRSKTYEDRPSLKNGIDNYHYAPEEDAAAS